MQEDVPMLGVYMGVSTWKPGGECPWYTLFGLQSAAPAEQGEGAHPHLRGS